METLTVAHNEQYGIPKYAGQTMTKADFLRWESDDNYVYEFNNGVLEPTTGMRQEEILLLRQLTRHFLKTSAYQRGDELVAEVDFWLSETQYRRPDVAYYSAEQLTKIASGERVIPQFVIEFGSETDTAQKNSTKRHEYFAAGVQVQWWVDPVYQEVHVYTSPRTVTICANDDQLSAAPVLADFVLTVAELFSR